MPNPTLTPGKTLPVTKQAVCTPGYSKTARHVTTATKRAVFAAYGFTGKETRFEIDHLISLELGGSNDQENLWPQAFTTKPFNATTKDGLENRLHWLVCNKGLPLKDAQEAIRKDWRVAFKHFVQEGQVR